MALLIGCCSVVSCEKRRSTYNDGNGADNTELSTADAEHKSNDFGLKLSDITLPDVDGKSHSLLEEAGKSPLTLIDFWASWCGPCMREMPNVRNLYHRYKKEGFNIIGVSLDNDRDAWIQAVDNMGLTWLQLSDLMGWQSLAVQAYGIETIPFTLLVDSQGYILGANLRGEALAKALEESIRL